MIIELVVKAVYYVALAPVWPLLTHQQCTKNPHDEPCYIFLDTKAKICGMDENGAGAIYCPTPTTEVHK